MLPPKELNSKDFQFQDNEWFKDNLHVAERWKKDIFLKYHIESIIAPKTEVLVSDISVRFSCQIPRGKGYLKVNAFFHKHMFQGYWNNMSYASLGEKEDWQIP